MYFLCLGVFFPLTRMILPPQYAALAMAVSSVSVVMSSMSLWMYKKPAYLSDARKISLDEAHSDSDNYVYNPVSLKVFNGLLYMIEFHISSVYTVVFIIY